MGNINSEQLSLLEQQLAESQAREKVRINALAIADHAFRHPDDDWKRDVDLRAQKVVGDALFMPADDTALKAVLAAERKRCAKVCDTVGVTLDTREMSRGAFAVSEAIRALENE